MGQGGILSLYRREREASAFLDDYDVLTGTPILTLPHRGGRDLSSPPLRGRVRVGVYRIYHFHLEAVLASGKAQAPAGHLVLHHLNAAMVYAGLKGAHEVVGE